VEAGSGNEKKMRLSPYQKRRLKQMVLKWGACVPIDPATCSKGVALCRALHDHGIPTTIGKFSQEGDPPETIVSEYQFCSTSLRAGSGENNFYLSLKPPALRFDTQRAWNICDIAIQNGHGVHFDSHDHDLQGLTIELLENTMHQTRAGLPKASSWRWGLTLPSRWKRSFGDLRWAIKNGVRVRIVKGEFKAARSSDEMNPREGFLAMVERLAGSVSEIAIATHDRQLAMEAIERTRRKKTRVELELLFGMPAGGMIALSKEMQTPLRFYVAYGENMLLYGIRHYLTNPRKFLRPQLGTGLGGANSKLRNILSATPSLIA
jgi:proline dehydrogenase